MGDGEKRTRGRKRMKVVGDCRIEEIVGFGGDYRSVFLEGKYLNIFEVQ